MDSSAEGRRHPLKLQLGGLQTIGRGGSGNVTTPMLLPSRYSLAEQGIRAPVGRDIQSVPRSGQISTTGRGGAGNAKSVKASKRRVSELEERAALAAENEIVEQHKREKAASSPLVTGRGGMGNIRKSKQDKSKLSPTLSQPCRPSTSQTRSSTISSLVLDISAEAFIPTPSGNPFHRRRHSSSDLSITEPWATTFPSLSLEGPETDHPWPIDDPPLTARTSYSIPESTFGALAEAHEGIASDHWTSTSARCFAGSPNSSLTNTGGSYYHRRLPSSVAPFEEPPMNSDLTLMAPSSSQRSQHRPVSTNPPKERSSPPPTRRTSTLGTPFIPSPPFDKYYTPEHRSRTTPVIILPPEQQEAPISPLSPPPRFSSPTFDSTPALSPRAPLFASSAPRVGYRTTLVTHGFRQSGGSRPSTSGSSYRPSIADNAVEMESAHSYKQREAALWRLKTPTKLISRISSQPGVPFIPLAAIANPAPRPARTGKAEVSSRIAGVNSSTRPIKIPDAPPQIPISIFVNPPSHSHSMSKASPTSTLAPSFRTTSSGSQHESFTPTFGANPLPPLPASSRRTTYTSLAPSEYTFPSAPTSPISVMEEVIEEGMEGETAEFAQLETG